MVKFYREFPEIEIVQSVAAQITWTHNVEIGQTPSVQIPWSHNLEILRVKSKDRKLWYINKTIENGWSVNVLAPQIDTNLYVRQIEKKKVLNFLSKLPSPQNELPSIEELITIVKKDI